MDTIITSFRNIFAVAVICGVVFALMTIQNISLIEVIKNCSFIVVPAVILAFFPALFRYGGLVLSLVFIGGLIAAGLHYI